MKTLILPDIHNKWETAESIIQSETPDLTIFLGDYFDDFGDNPTIIADCADWFHHSINQPKRIHLCGNHDVHYWFANNPDMRCSGYEQFKSMAINDLVKPEDWSKLKFFHVLDDKWLLSHAGLHPHWVDPMTYRETGRVKTSLKKVAKMLEFQSEKFLISTSHNQIHWFGVPGFSRCRSAQGAGGILWCDFGQEFRPIKGIDQIVGHTPGREPRWKCLGADDFFIDATGVCIDYDALAQNGSNNLCLDTHLRNYAVYEDGKLRVETVNKA
jgi:hypothetical protein